MLYYSNDNQKGGDSDEETQVGGEDPENRRDIIWGLGSTEYA